MALQLSGTWHAAQSIFIASPWGDCAWTWIGTIPKAGKNATRMPRDHGPMAFLRIHAVRSVPIGMAIEAGGTVVRIPVLPAMIIVDLGLVVVLMAIDATEHTIVVRVGVAFNARVPLPVVRSTIDREVHPVVIERGRRPCRYTVALGAIRGELGCLVVRVDGGVEIRHVARITIRRRALIAVGMALETTRARMPSGQRKARRAMIERRRGPGSFIVALRTVGGELGSGMVRVGGAIVIRHMAGIAVGRCTLIAIGMAGDAVDACMATSQGKIGRTMIEGRIVPGRLIVA